MSTIVIIVGVIIAGLVVGAFGALRRGPEPDDGEFSDDAPRRPERYTVQRLRVLVVDDNPVIVRAAERLLSSHDVTTATTSEAALSALALDERRDAILYSFAMPGMSGLQFATTIAEQHPDLQSRIVFLVNGAATPDARRLLVESEAHWISKPLNYAQLVTCISEAAARRGVTTHA